MRVFLWASLLIVACADELKKRNLQSFHLNNDYTIPKAPYLCDRAFTHLEKSKEDLPSVFEVIMDCAGLYISGLPDADGDVGQWKKLRDRLRTIMFETNPSHQWFSDDDISRLAHSDISKVQVGTVKQRKRKVEPAQMIALLWRYALLKQRRLLEVEDEFFIKDQHRKWRSDPNDTVDAEAERIILILTKTAIHPRVKVPPIYVYISPFGPSRLADDTDALKYHPDTRWGFGDSS